MWIYGMPVTDRELLFSAIPYQDESFIGYLLRITERNHYETLSWILQLAGISDYASSKLSLSSNGVMDLTPLGKLTGVEQSKLASLLYSPLKKKSQTYGYSVFGTAVPHYMIRLRYPKFCPSCLCESAYIRKIWELAAVTVCPIHRILLIDECPNCKKRITWNREAVCSCRCKFDWRESKPVSINNSDINVTNQIYRLCGFWADTTHTDEKVNNPLYELKSDEFLSALFFIAGQFDGIIDIKGKRLATSKRNIDIHQLLSRAFSVFQDWPTNYFSFLEWRRRFNPDVRYVRGLRRDFGQYKYALYQQLSPAPFDFLRNSFKDYLLKRWEGGTVSTIPRINFEEQSDRKYISKTETVKLLGLKQRVIDRLIAKGRLKAIVEGQGKSKMFLINMADVESLSAYLGQAVGIKQVCKLLGIIEQRVLDLVKHQIINPILDTRVDKVRRWIFSQKEVHDLLLTIKDKVKRKAVANKDKLSFLSALRGLTRYNIDTGQFVRAILDKIIIPCSFGSEGNLSSLYFSREQVIEYRRRCLRDKMGDVFTTSEIASQLRVTLEAVYSLLNQNILPSIRTSDSISLIPKGDLDNFNAKYIFTSKVARSLGTESTHLSNLLIEEGLQPISLQRANGSYRYLFKKSDLDLLDLDKLLVIGKERKLLKQKEMLILSLAQVANTLKIKVENVIDLVERGILRPYTRGSRKEMDHYNYRFSYEVIDKYQSCKINFDGLVSAGVAAKMLREDLSSFYRKYYHSGQLKALKVEGKNKGNLFFKMKDIYRIDKEKKNLITSLTAAAMLELHQSSVSRMAQSGKLKPSRGPQVDGFAFNLFIRSDIEKLYAERVAFKQQCIKEGKTTRWGCPHPKLHLTYSVN
jgi:TniQ